MHKEKLMNIYFACSITGGRDDESVYQKIVSALLSDGHKVPTALLAGSDVIEAEVIVNPREVYTRDTSWIDDCDCLIAEVSTPSHGVGYEIGYALNLNKPVLCLHRTGEPVSKMITGNRDPNLTVTAYKDEVDAVKQMQRYLRLVRSQN